MAEPQISLTSSADKPTRRDQIDQAVRLATDRKEPIRIRIPLQVYRNGPGGYNELRDTAWNFAIEPASTQSVEQFIENLEMVMRSLATTESKSTPVDA